MIKMTNAEYDEIVRTEFAAPEIAPMTGLLMESPSAMRDIIARGSTNPALALTLLGVAIGLMGVNGVTPDTLDHVLGSLQRAYRGSLGDEAAVKTTAPKKTSLSSKPDDTQTWFVAGSKTPN